MLNDLEILDNKNNKHIIDEFYSITKNKISNDLSLKIKKLNELISKYKNIDNLKFEINKNKGLNVKTLTSDIIFDKVSNINEESLDVSKETDEYGAFLSYSYNVDLSSRKYLFYECNRNKNSRFLSFFTLRYGVNFKMDCDSLKYGIAKKRFWESELFGSKFVFSIKIAVDIFSILNFKYKPREGYNDDSVKKSKSYYMTQTHLDWIKYYEENLLYLKKIAHKLTKSFIIKMQLQTILT